jgi:hypothetical protein
MKSTPYAAFKYVAMVCEAPKGWPMPFQNVREVGFRFFLSGLVETTFNDGTKKLYKAGDVLFDTNSITNRSIEYLEDTTWMCVSKAYNLDIPTPEMFVMPTGQEYEAVDGSDIFIAKGVCEVREKIYTGPKALRVRGGNAIIKPIVDCYVSKFK